MTKKNNEVMSPEDLAIFEELKQSYPVEATFNRTLLPRLGFYSQDQTEGKGKAMKVVAEAGTFFIEHQTDEIDEETGKKTWEREEIGNEVELIILYERKQLKFFDGEKYTSSPIYDSDDQIIPLFYDKGEVDRGTPKELKSRPQYQGKSAKGKDISKLEDNKILYVLYKDEVYQMNLRGTSMFAFMTYKREVTPNTVVTVINSESKENGAIAWNQMTFKIARSLKKDELQDVVNKVKEIREGIEMERQFYATKSEESVKADQDMGKLGSGKF